jgi:hypothetical protein
LQNEPPGGGVVIGNEIELSFDADAPCSTISSKAA